MHHHHHHHHHTSTYIIIIIIIIGSPSSFFFSLLFYMNKKNMSSLQKSVCVSEDNDQPFAEKNVVLLPRQHKKPHDQEKWGFDEDEVSHVPGVLSMNVSDYCYQ